MDYFPKNVEDYEVQAEIYSKKETDEMLVHNAKLGLEGNTTVLKYAVFCGANNETLFFSNKKLADKYRNKLIDKWYGTGICPSILVLRAEELSVTF